jgi:tetratricopeptide (TPR) repeat protein
MTGRRVLLGAALVLLTALGGATWWWLRPVPPAPPMPPGIEDPEVFEAIRAAQQPVLEDPYSAAAWGQLGKVILAQQFDREADICFAEACRLDPDDPRWLYARCVIAQKRDPDHAVEILQKAAELAEKAHPEHPRYRSAIKLQLAEALLERGRLEEAEPLFEAEHRENPDNARASLGLGLIAQSRGDGPRAESLLKAAQLSESVRRYATVQLALLARTRGDIAQAEVYEKAIATMISDVVWPDPFFEEVAPMHVGERGFERLVRRLEMERHFAEAARLYEKRLKTHPTIQNHVGAALNYSRPPLRDYDRALPHVREAVRLDPKSAFAHYSLAQVVFARAERVWQTEPNSPQVLEWFRESLDHAKQAAELRPGYAEAYLFWGLSLKYLGRPEEAVEPLRRGVAGQPANKEQHLALGQALLESGQLTDEAENCLEAARRLAPDDPRPIQALDSLRLKKKKAGKV